MNTRWRLRPFDADRVALLSREANLSPLVAQILLNRGVQNASEAATFFDRRLVGLHDPESLPGVIEAADRIVRAIRDRRKIVIYGDYDVDGVCGTTILWDCLRLAGASDVEYYIPHRVDEGYGVNAEALRTLATEHRADLIVTVDCGISAVREAKLARELGLEFIVTDHHTLGLELPEADVLVHPRLPGSLYPFGDLCGCGVAFKLAWQICKSFGDGKRASPHLRDFLIRSIGLVAMATVADVMPIKGENRLLIHNGLLELAQSRNEGLKALIEVSGFLGKSLSTGNIGFGLAPRINAAGRLERAMQAVEMLTTDDPELARKHAEALDLCNKQRQEVERRIIDEAHEMIAKQGGLNGRGAIVLGREGWHPGVIGIVAGRLAETFHRPAIVVALNADQGQGSARSIAGFDLYEAIHACSDGLTTFGGHAAAAGLKLPRDRFEAFAEAFETHCTRALSPEQLQKSILIDAEVPLGSLTLRVVQAIEALEPHGVGNPRPLLVANRVRVIGDPRAVGERKNHLQLGFAQGDSQIKAIGFNLADRGKVLKSGTLCSVAFHPSINDWQGRKSVQLELKDFRLEEEEGHAQSA
ncbi:single-stranded-DNA-specific exonuclease RecJ [Tundrisphaera lichenicola]|uniref:single-stranded-DNA-specific exonuclease RecJ n=1 Tax=Tundrisphaera lichenicola TaxID=2029860 RepID=UPI003EBDDE5C